MSKFSLVGWCGLAVATMLLVPPAAGHEVGGGHDHHADPAAVPLPKVVETRGPVRVARRPAGTPLATSGQGYWQFAAAPELVPVPATARPALKGAHGTLVVDAERDRVYWGLERVGWIEFSEKLSRSRVVDGDPAFASGNLHGADLLPRRGQLPLVVAADNVEGEVYLSDTAFARATKVGVPPGGPYADGKGYAPTDAAFTSPSEIYVTDGYGKAYFMPATTDPLGFKGEFHGGKAASQTPHGITYDSASRTLLVSARPEGQVKRWSPATQHWLEVHGLPPGSTVCDVDLWGDYALAPCLNGPDNSPGPIYILNLKKKAIVSTLRPKVDLGFTEAQHIHDACWYVSGKGRKRELFVLFTNWNPGGVGALKLVGPAD
jgi:hypothetical protein